MRLPSPPLSCPTACALPIQVTPDPADRIALQDYAALRKPEPQATGHGAGPVVLDR